MRYTGKVGILASEEEDTPVDLVGVNKEVIYDEGSQYVTVFDPLDGSSNIDAGIPTGTIFGIFHHDESCGMYLLNLLFYFLLMLKPLSCSLRHYKFP